MSYCAFIWLLSGVIANDQGHNGRVATLVFSLSFFGCIVSDVCACVCAFCKIWVLFITKVLFSVLHHSVIFHKHFNFTSTEKPPKNAIEKVSYMV